MADLARAFGNPPCNLPVPCAACGRVISRNDRSGDPRLFAVERGRGDPYKCPQSPSGHVRPAE